jgi:pectinesterase
MAGTYREKVTITVPNLIMIGEDEATTIITFNAASGTQQPNGSTWGTQGSATVSIKSSATGFMAKNITFQNDFNFNQSTITDKQGVALVNEADQVIFYQVSFKGYQDTLYAKSGRQYYLDVYIEGVVDFIFGNGGPAFFENSEIRSLARSTGVIATNKGYNTQNTLLISFGYVFYNNTFTFEQGVPAGSVDLGRPWDKSAAIMYIHNTFGAHISSRGWTDMSGNLPQDARFFEFENRDTNQLLLPTTTNGKTLSSELVSSAIDKAVVFGVNNGLVTFSSEWLYQNALTYLQSIE